ncbi:vesicular inhibitory amino acid transporter [Exaiptasia diaphana]|uniref:Amino acid transporter transmembrane domain-containing protein n=1 Tax=Exaiptasia diaphana TaxID=2652724 RepID=A0A913YIN1_EXADI|nr:vesicular inhibitory amino acid transporter [Exaiptasia diaphana]
MGESAIENSEYTLLTGQDDNEKVNKPDVGDKKDKASNYKSSIWQSVSNLVSDIEGTGLLALPYVIQRGGLVAIVGLAIVPFICYYTGKILIDCLYVKDSNNKKIRVRTNYKDMAGACWPRYGGHLVFIIQVVELFLLASLYLVLYSLNGCIESLCTKLKRASGGYGY